MAGAPVGPVDQKVPGSPRQRSLRWVLTCGLLMAATFLLSAEVASRLDDYLRAGVPLTAVPDAVRDLVIHDSLGVRGKPNGRYKQWKLNSAGFRSSEAVLTPKPGCVRVMTIGTSETYGGPAEGPGKEYPAQLHDSLAKHGCYQILNAAIVGQPLEGLIHLWDAWASRFHPDIVVVLASPGSYLAAFPQVLAAAAPTGGKPAAAPADPWWRHPRLMEKAHDYLHFPDFVNRWRVQKRLTAMTAGQRADWFIDSIPLARLEEYRRDLDSMVTTIRSHGARPILATYPDRFGTTTLPEDRDLLAAWSQYWPRARPQVMLNFMAAGAEVLREEGQCRGVAVADLSKAMSGRRELFDDFVHYKETGSSMVAELVTHAVLAVAADSVNPPAAGDCR